MSNCLCYSQIWSMSVFNKVLTPNQHINIKLGDSCNNSYICKNVSKIKKLFQSRNRYLTWKTVKIKKKQINGVTDINQIKHHWHECIYDHSQTCSSVLVFDSCLSYLLFRNIFCLCFHKVFQLKCFTFFKTCPFMADSPVWLALIVRYRMVAYNC